MNEKQIKIPLLAKYRSKRVAALAIALLAIIIVSVLEMTNATNFLHSTSATSGKIPTVNGKTATSSSLQKGETATDKPAPAPTSYKTDTPAGTTQSALPLQAPFGTFVSNHSSDLSDSASLKQESVCNTTPGASCSINFTNEDGVVKSLDTQKVGIGAAVYWQWNVKDAGFTAGTWKITATATLNGESKSTPDPLNLNVKP